MTKLVFYGWEIGMRGIPFAKMLKEKTHLGLDEAWKVMIKIIEGKSYEFTSEDEKLADEI